MSNIVPITAIVVSGVVGPSLTAWWSRSRQRDDQRQERLSELRGVLDDGTTAVGAAKHCFQRIYNLRRQGVAPDEAEAVKSRAEWREAMKEVRALEARIAIRVGDDHPVHRRFAEWVETLEAQQQFARAFERDEVTQRRMADQAVSHEAFENARVTFIQEARKIVGSRVPGAAS